MDIPPQDVITKDNVTVKVNAVLYFRVIDPLKCVIEVQDYLYATSQLAQTTLRSVLGQVPLDDLLSERDKLNARLQEIIEQHTDPWGIKVQLVEMKQVDLPENMIRAIAKQAEAERERRAKVIHADGEFQAADKLTQAADIISQQSPGPPAPVPGDADRDRRREELHDRFPPAARAPQSVLVRSSPGEEIDR